MNLEDFREQAKESLKTFSERVIESSLFIQLKEKYENLNPNMQSLLIMGSITLVLGGLLIMPLQTISTSNESIEDFEVKRTITRDLMRATRDAEQIPKIPVAPPIESIVDRINAEAKQAQFLPEQIVSVAPSSPDSKMIPSNLTAGAVTAHFIKLNLRQILDMSYQLTRFGLSVKMSSLSITANTELPGYFDMTAKLIALKVPQMDMSQFQDSSEDKSDSKNKFKKPINKNESKSKKSDSEDAE